MASNYTGNFVFINKDAQNLDERDKDEAFAISSHVTHAYYHWAKHHQGSYPRQHTWLNRRTACGRFDRRGVSPTTADPQSRRKAHRKQDGFGSWASFQIIADQRRAHREQSVESSSSWSTSAYCNRRPSSPKPPSDPAARRKQSCLLRCPAAPLGHGNSDPFDAAPLPTTAFHHELMHVWRSYFMSFTCAPGASSRLQAIAEQKWRERVADAVGDEAELSGWFAGALMVKIKLINPEDHSRIWPRALMYQSKALACLRSRLKKDPVITERTLLTIWSIATVDFYSGDWQSNHAHCLAINRIVESLGGLNQVSPMTKLHVIIGDIFTANLNLVRPVYDFSEYDAGCWSDQAIASEHNDLLPNDRTHYARWDEAFLSDDDPLSDDISDYLKAQREFVSVHMMTKTIPANRVQKKDDVLEWLHGRRMALSAISLSIYCDLQEDLEQRVPPAKASLILRRKTQQAVVLCANWLVWFTYENDVLPKWLIYIPSSNLRKVLQDLLHVMASRGRLYNLEVPFWLAFVGASAEKASLHAGIRPGMDERWFTKWFLTLAKMLKLRTWKQAKKILRRFVYDELVLDRFAESLFVQRDGFQMVNLLMS